MFVLEVISYVYISLKLTPADVELLDFKEMYYSLSHNRMTRAASRIGSSFTSSDEYPQLLAVTKGMFLQLQLSTDELTGLGQFLDSAINNVFRLVHVDSTGAVNARNYMAHLWKTVQDL